MGRALQCAVCEQKHTYEGAKNISRLRDFHVIFTLKKCAIVVVHSMEPPAVGWRSVTPACRVGSAGSISVATCRQNHFQLDFKIRPYAQLAVILIRGRTHWRMAMIERTISRSVGADS